MTTQGVLEPGCTHSVLHRAVWLKGRGWVCVDDDHPSCHYRIEEWSQGACPTASYWHSRFLRMKAFYRERFTEGLSTQEWHEKYCQAFVASKILQAKVAEVIREIQSNSLSLSDVADRFEGLLDRGPEVPPQCNHHNSDIDLDHPEVL